MDRWAPTSPFSIDYLWVGLIRRLSWAEPSAISICFRPRLPRYYSRGGEARGGEGRGGGSGTLRTLSPTHKCKYTRQHVLRFLLASSAQSKRMRHPCTHARLGVPADQLVWPPSRTGSPDCFTLLGTLKMREGSVSSGSPGMMFFLEAVK